MMIPEEQPFFFFTAIVIEHSASNSPPLRRGVNMQGKLENEVTVMQSGEIMVCVRKSQTLEIFPSLTHSLPEGE